MAGRKPARSKSSLDAALDLPGFVLNLAGLVLKSLLYQTWQVQKKTCQVKIKFGRCS